MDCSTILIRARGDLGGDNSQGLRGEPTNGDANGVLSKIGGVVSSKSVSANDMEMDLKSMLPGNEEASTRGRLTVCCVRGHRNELLITGRSLSGLHDFKVSCWSPIIKVSTIL